MSEKRQIRIESLSPRTLAGKFFEEKFELTHDEFWKDNYCEPYMTNGQCVLEAVDEYGQIYYPNYPDYKGHRDRIVTISAQFKTLQVTGLGDPEVWNTTVAHLNAMKTVQQAEIDSLSRSLREYARLLGALDRVDKDGGLDGELKGAVTSKKTRQGLVANNYDAAREVLNQLESIIQLATDIQAGLQRQQAGGRTRAAETVRKLP